MRIGVTFPQDELGGDPGALRRFAVEAENLGFEDLLLYDHVLGAVHGIDRDPPLPPHSYSEKDPFIDPLVAFGYLAGVTERIGFITGVLILPQRQTPLVARQAADVQTLSGGRLMLGVGLGHNPVEYDALGQDFRTRGRRVAEQIPYLRRLWSGEPFAWRGEFDRLDNAALFPPPSEPIPILYGGSADVALRRAAQIADGFVFGFGMSAAALEQWARLQELLQEAGRATGDFRAVFDLLREVAGSADAAATRAVADAVERLAARGGSHATVNSARHGLVGVDDHLRFIAAAKRAIDERVS
ncbi:TIGR03619 family F420-dependent LLM class oxidoreductase [Microbacterium sp. NPDC091313]